MYAEFKELQKHLEDGAHVTCLGLAKSDLFSYLFGKAWLKTLRTSVIENGMKCGRMKENWL